ncbi:unnamed protein product [Anisakis simplex]|uniref:Transcription initiation factor TFIID subunit 6 n=1 Tax=Anisakis simplex TaxID=6269 RepID=A0A0M3K5T5_ANISI|nr:unnamed protein product [Anisakis simplex]
MNSNSRHDNDKLFVSADDYQSVDLMNLINNQSQKFPQRLLYKAHWLIYEGEQPSIVQNAVVIPEKSSVVEEDSEENADDISTTSTRESSMLFGASMAYRESLKKIRKFERINVKPTSTYLLSLEQQRFFKEIMEACVGLDDKRRMEALESLQLDTSLQSLLPNISRWLAQGVHANIVQRSLAMLIYIVRAHSALIHNRSLNLKPVLHEMIPSLLSCMISKQLCVRPDIDNHWTLRDFASKCLVQLIRERGGICDVRNRVQRTLAVCFTDVESTENMKYGAFHALFDLSNTDQRVALYPHFVEILRAVHPSKTSSMPQQQKIDSTKLYTLLSRFEQAMNKYATVQGRGSSSSSRLFVGTEYGADYVKLVAETIGITNLSEKCASQVGASVTFVIKELLEQSKKFASHARRKRVIADDFVEALKFRGHSPIFGLSSKEGVSYRLVGSTGRIVNVSAHWLVIDGEQPAVPENPIPKYDEDLASTASSSVNEKVEQQQQNDIGGSHSLLSILSSQNTKKLRKIEQIQVKTITTHTLSLEQQIFFKEITEAIMGSDDSRRTEALHSLQTDAGIQILLPRFSLAIAEGVRCNIVHHNLAILIYLMRMIQSIASNPALSLDRCLHELLPSILSCILSKQLCARPETDNHWALREFSSRLLSTICRAYNVNGLRSRITQVLTRVWQEENSTLATLYGSIYALNELGIDTIRAVIVPRAPQLYNDIKKAQSDKSNPVDKVGAEKVYSFVTKVLTNYVRTQRPTGLKDVNDYRTMFGGFGDAIFR